MEERHTGDVSSSKTFNSLLYTTNRFHVAMHQLFCSVKDPVLDVATSEVASATGFHSLATNFSHLVARLATKIFLFYHFYLIFHSLNGCNERSNSGLS